MRHAQGQLPLMPAARELSGLRSVLLTEYQHLVREELPQAARKGGWNLCLDHCFARVILDALFEGCWYDYLTRGKSRSAESQLDADQLRQALVIARRMLEAGDAEVRRLDAQSLRWRGKRPKTLPRANRR